MLWPQAPFLCLDDAMIDKIYAEHTKTQKTNKFKEYPTLKIFVRKHNFPIHAKRKRCYDVTSLWRTKQELGHLASGL